MAGLRYKNFRLREQQMLFKLEILTVIDINIQRRIAAISITSINLYFADLNVDSPLYM